LESALAGLPPRRPVADALEQTLKQAKRSFAVRTWLSVVLFSLGIALFALIFVYVWGTNFSPDPLVTATAAFSGVISFVLSMVANRQSEIRDTLDQIAQLQLEIAERAQRSDILDLYVAHLVKEGFSGDRLDTLREALTWLEPSNATHAARAEYTVPNDKHATDDEGLEHWPTENPRVGALVQEGRSRR
jgi:signal transduction histidine kinase